MRKKRGEGIKKIIMILCFVVVVSGYEVKIDIKHYMLLIS